MIDQLQNRVVEWGRRCFGDDHMSDTKLRALRLLEEAIEFSQAVGVPIEQAARLVNYVYTRPVGNPEQELGGVGVCALAAAGALGVSTAQVLLTEIDRVESKSPEHFAARNKAKCDAGFGEQ